MKKISIKVLLTITIAVILTIVLIIILMNNNGKSSTVVKTFESEYGNFEVKVPKQWKCNEDPFIESTVDREGTPDGGLQIHIDNESIIFISVSRSRIYYNGTFQENIYTDDGIKANAYSYNNDGRINEIELTDSIRVTIKCSNNDYNKYIKNILSMVKTIKIKK